MPKLHASAWFRCLKVLNGFDAPWDGIIEQTHFSCAWLLFSRLDVKKNKIKLHTSLQLRHVVCSASALYLKGTLLLRFKYSANMSNLVPFSPIQLNVIVCLVDIIQTYCLITLVGQHDFCNAEGVI